MKKIITICAAFLMTASVFAQSPEKMSYHAVVRDGSNNLVSSTAVGIQISILQGSASGTAVYVETQIPTSNANGLVSLEIGDGTVVSGDFASIDWANGPYFIQTETDSKGGTNYTITGTSQLLSVPYALYAENAGNSTPGPQGPAGLDGNGIASTVDNGDGTFTFTYDDGSTFTTSDLTGPTGPQGPAGTVTNDFYLGQDTLGGIVFYIYLDTNGDQRGLIVSKTETFAQWQSSPSVTNATRSWDGVYNTGLMTNSPAATYVNGLTDGGFTDWYLPSIDELSILWHNRFHANNALNAGGFTLLSTSVNYWSSTELIGSPLAFYFSFAYGSTYNSLDNYKTTGYNVRAVRAF